MLKAINIKWDTDGDEEVLQNLPTEMIIPDYLAEHYDEEYEYNFSLGICCRSGILIYHI